MLYMTSTQVRQLWPSGTCETKIKASTDARQWTVSLKHQHQQHCLAKLVSETAAWTRNCSDTSHWYWAGVQSSAVWQAFRISWWRKVLSIEHRMMVQELFGGWCKVLEISALTASWRRREAKSVKLESETASGYAAYAEGNEISFRATIVANW